MLRYVDALMPAYAILIIYARYSGYDVSEDTLLLSLRATLLMI